ncbi:Predicted acyltransferase [Hymenobacter gelipurpurascens]|uniref:Predicted acyltransferase n=1 Tax=Hymenobacter gelipurpurascens TaxID=89968 RepID=A0A212TRG2_9BACT|nr:heparan-alpha-glucosaminide N-acetyltransferase domain-containing protein [Hymenobacter gelipurpurascens]SNC68451.1 Predicted acyltransferase [Hymenobacter gelipurpurascens]
MLIKNPSATAPPETHRVASRLVSLDVFRGLTIVLMLLVNSPGDWHFYYSPITHADWNGFHLADLVFPAFVFIMGVALVYGLATVRETPDLHAKTLRRVARRVLVMVVLGLLIGLLPNFYFTSFRILGVLQRLALVYGLSALCFLKMSWRQQAWLTVALLVAYAVLLQLVPVPGLGYASLEKSTNLGAWLDRLLIGKEHLYTNEEGWDAESLLGTLPALASGLLGVLAGQWLRATGPDAPTKTAWLFVVSSGTLVLGLIWNGWFPINKALWSSSFVLYAGGLSGLMLAALYFVLDVQQWRPRGLWLLLACGSNTLVVFFGAEAIERILTRLKLRHPDGSVFYPRDWLYDTLCRPYFANPYHASLTWAIVYTCLWIGLLAFLYRRRIFITA